MSEYDGLSYSFCGMGAGDCGKGSFIDFAVHENDIMCIVRYNGGSQAAHNVITPSGKKHQFCQLGSGMFNEDCETFFTKNTIVDLDGLYVEIMSFAKVVEYLDSKNILKRIHINQDCYLVTPYHKLINRFKELAKPKEKRRGTVGTGVSEARFLEQSEGLGIQIKDCVSIESILERLQPLYEYMRHFYFKHELKIENNIESVFKGKIEDQIVYLLSDKNKIEIATKLFNLMRYFQRCVYKDNKEIFEKFDRVIFEGTQGLLIDGTYGIKPNTTLLDVTNRYASELAYDRKLVKIGISKAFMTRHGPGVFPTESVELRVTDENQGYSYWNGRMRFGWFDAVLFRYAQSINQVDEVYLSCIDKLDNTSCIKICNMYDYFGKITEEFANMFVYHEADGHIYITDIKSTGDNISKYLKRCKPVYILVDGWNTDTTKLKRKWDLPENCIKFISLIEELGNVKITLVSVGPTRNDKIRM
jgi:adenylosuccinate synthase